MSCTKLLSRIVTPTDLEEAGQHEQDLQFSISTDPLTRFACLFSALIHDVDHLYVPTIHLCCFLVLFCPY